MKELSIEEKAKRYDEAIEIAKKINNEQQAQPFNIMTRVFPELKEENEDERIRKSLIELVKQSCDVLYPPNQKAMLVWLEKQGKNNMGISEATKKKLEDNLNKALEKETPESWNEFLEKQGEQKPVKVDFAFKIGEVITDGTSTFKIVAIKEGYYIADNGDEVPFYIAHRYYTIIQNFETQKPVEWSEEDEAIYYGIIETEQYMLDVVNGIKKFDVGNISIKEECTRELNWLKFLKDRVLPQPKQEWSEEDIRKIDELTALCEGRKKLCSPTVPA